jgi:hypothetical protein
MRDMQRPFHLEDVLECRLAGMSLLEIAVRFGRTRERIRQILTHNCSRKYKDWQAIKGYLIPRNQERAAVPTEPDNYRLRLS